ncbi:hypothetical protein [Rhodococcus sp. UNC23MFCrub1.1]|uniref:hypothetical protein n=1 Tax=Rhodococcus sp. UNC23MFCrub1.1 TaxID=1449068 RepID=UPI0012DE694D|nr:hypothetical protein [Rhodococcus sp. UNC23MFCrub1.1]
MDHDERAALVLDGHDPDDLELLAAHAHVTDILRAHRHLTTEPGPLRDWYRTTALTRLPGTPDPD